MKQVSLFTPEFDERLKALKSDDARASEMEHALKDEIHVRLDENPVFFTSLRERLEQILEDRKAKRIDAAEQMKLFEIVKGDIRGHASAAEKLGLTEAGFAIYGLITEPKPLEARDVASSPHDFGYAALDEPKRELATLLEEQLEPHAAIVDWVVKDDVQREMRRLIKRQLKAAGYPSDKTETTAEGVVDLLKRRSRR